MSYLLKKLSGFIDLPEADCRLLLGHAANAFPYGPREDLIREGDKPYAVLLVEEGWLCRYKVQKDGARQILGLLLPGDMCDMHIFILKQMDHSIATIGPARVATITATQMFDIIDNNPRLNRAFWWMTLVDEGVQRAWLANIGGNDSFTRVAHLFCELGMRLTQIGLAENGGFMLPLTQRDIADALGITSIHANRIIGRLRHEGYISLRNGHLVIRDFPRLAETCDFRANYLHLDHEFLQF